MAFSTEELLWSPFSSPVTVSGVADIALNGPTVLESN